jgi:hypothetical protein
VLPSESVLAEIAIGATISMLNGLSRPPVR